MKSFSKCLPSEEDEGGMQEAKLDYQLTTLWLPHNFSLSCIQSRMLTHLPRLWGMSLNTLLLLFYHCEETMTKATYRRKHLAGGLLTVSDPGGGEHKCQSVRLGSEGLHPAFWPH